MKNKHVLWAGLGALLLIIFCYWCIDIPVVDAAKAYNLRQWVILDFFTHSVDVLLPLATAGFCGLALALLLGSTNKHVFNLWLVCSNVLLTQALKNNLKFVFARYWPDTWVDNNLSWLHDKAYGFNWFKAGSAYKSFPSGHAAVLFAAISMLWWLYPKLRPLAFLLGLAMTLGLITNYYHFVSDVIAGAFLGSFTGFVLCKQVVRHPMSSHSKRQSQG